MVTTLWSDALQDIFLGIPTEPTSEEGGSSPATSSTSLTYGELSWESFDAILKAALEVVDSGGAGGAVQPEAQPRLSFVNIGSGFGRLVLGLTCCESSARFRLPPCCGWDLACVSHVVLCLALLFRGQ